MKSNLTFNEVATPPERKTKIFKVKSNHDIKAELGVIQWHSNWRQYCFWPYSNTLFSWDCLNEISEKIQSLMAERKG